MTILLTIGVLWLLIDVVVVLLLFRRGERMESSNVIAGSFGQMRDVK